MSSLRKIDANRENGKLGGPKTAEGKMKSALNSIKHGLSGNTLVLTNESRPMYNDLLDSFLERFQPADPVEFELVLEMVGARWRLRRAWSIETAMIDLEMDDQEDAIAKDRGDIDEVVRIAVAFKSLAETRGLSLLNRYETRIRRTFERAYADLRLLQSTRAAAPAPPAGSPNVPNEPTAPAEPSAPPAPTRQTQLNQTNPGPDASSRCRLGNTASETAERELSERLTEEKSRND